MVFHMSEANEILQQKNNYTTISKNILYKICLLFNRSKLRLKKEEITFAQTYNVTEIDIYYSFFLLKNMVKYKKIF